MTGIHKWSLLVVLIAFILSSGKGLGSLIEGAKKSARVPVLACPVVMLQLQSLYSVKDVSLAIWITTFLSCALVALRRSNSMHWPQH